MIYIDILAIICACLVDLFWTYSTLFCSESVQSVYILCHVLLLVAELALANHHVYIHAGSGQKKNSRKHSPQRGNHRPQIFRISSIQL